MSYDCKALSYEHKAIQEQDTDTDEYSIFQKTFAYCAHICVFIITGGTREVLDYICICNTSVFPPKRPRLEPETA